MGEAKRINRKYATDRLRVDYAHVGLFETHTQTIYIARKRWNGPVPVRVSHARLLAGGSQEASTAEKDRFLCYWYHTPGTGEGYIHGYPIEWQEGHLLIRIDPHWDYLAGRTIPAAHRRKVDRNIDQQFAWGKTLFDTYVAERPGFPLSYHMVGPRPTDSMFYVERVEG